MSNASGEIKVTVTAEIIEHLMEPGPSQVRVSGEPIPVYVRCEDSLGFEVVTDE
jgi:hypothetical protein